MSRLFLRGEREPEIELFLEKFGGDYGEDEGSVGILAKVAGEEHIIMIIGQNLDFRRCIGIDIAGVKTLKNGRIRLNERSK